MADDYSPRTGSLAARICAWFKANPSRRLTTAELCARFGANGTNLAAQIGAAEDADLVASEFVGRSNVYSAGPKLKNWTPRPEDAAQHESVNAPAPAALPTLKPARRAPTVKLQLKPEDLVIESNIPLARATTGAAATGLFDAKFAAMAVGQSFARPHAEAKRLKDSADRWSHKRAGGKVRFALRRIDETTSRVWRTE